MEFDEDNHPRILELDNVCRDCIKKDGTDTERCLHCQTTFKKKLLRDALREVKK